MKQIGINKYKNPLSHQYVAPEGYSFYYNGVNMGRIIYTSNPDGYWVDKDEELDIIVELEDDGTDNKEL